MLSLTQTLENPYTSKSKGRAIVIENECMPIAGAFGNIFSSRSIGLIYARNREDGGNGLGLYIVSSILTNLNFYLFVLTMQDPLGMSFTINL